MNLFIQRDRRNSRELPLKIDQQTRLIDFHIEILQKKKNQKWI